MSSFVQTDLEICSESWGRNRAGNARNGGFCPSRKRDPMGFPHVTEADLDLRFDHHPPPNPLTVALHEELREECKGLARQVVHLVPAGREQAMALSALELVMMHGNAGIARSHAQDVDGKAVGS